MSIKFAGRVSVYSEFNQWLYGASRTRALALFDTGQMDVSCERNGMVFGLRFKRGGVRSGAEAGGRNGSGMGGTRYVQYAPVGERGIGIGLGAALAVGSGLRAHRHRNELILPHRDEFLRVVAGAGGAGYVSDDELRVRRTCLLVELEGDE